MEPNAQPLCTVPHCLEKINTLTLFATELPNNVKNIDMLLKIYLTLKTSKLRLNFNF